MACKVCKKKRNNKFCYLVCFLAALIMACFIMGGIELLNGAFLMENHIEGVIEIDFSNPDVVATFEHTISFNKFFGSIFPLIGLAVVLCLLHAFKDRLDIGEKKDKEAKK